MAIVFCTNYTFARLKVSGIRDKFPFTGEVWKSDISDIISQDEEDRLLSQKMILARPEAFVSYLLKNVPQFSGLKYHVFRDCDAMLSDYTEIVNKWVNGKLQEVVIGSRPNSGVTTKLDELLTDLEKKILANISNLRGTKPDEKEKGALIRNIVNYYRAMFNPTGGVKENLLVSLGLSKCKVCSNREKEETNSKFYLG